MKDRLLNIAVVISCVMLILLFCFVKFVMLHHEVEDANMPISAETEQTEEKITEYNIELTPTEGAHDMEPSLEMELTYKRSASEETCLPETQIDVDIEGETYTVTAYCGCEKCCGKSDGITASGTVATEGRTIAVDPTVIPYGTTVYIDGQAFVAEDCGGAIKGKHIDMFFESHDAAVAFGVRKCTVMF